MSRRPLLVPVVEGQAEVEAVPVLLRRLLHAAGVFDIDVGVPHFRHRSEMVRSEEHLRRIVTVASFEPGCRGILVLLDADDDCPKHLREKLEPWAAGAARGVPCRVVAPNREFEAWFLASMESLRTHRGISAEAVSEEKPEMRRNAKKAVERWMTGRSYKERTDQPALTAHLDLARAHRMSRSFRHLCKALGELVCAAGATLPEWPPPSWG
ncbi:MAG: DUF4276 family protein [Polyangiaceae bacterium]